MKQKFLRLLHTGVRNDKESLFTHCSVSSVVISRKVGVQYYKLDIDIDTVHMQNTSIITRNPAFALS